MGGIQMLLKQAPADEHLSTVIISGDNTGFRRTDNSKTDNRMSAIDAFNNSLLKLLTLAGQYVRKIVFPGRIPGSVCIKHNIICIPGGVESAAEGL